MVWSSLFFGQTDESGAIRLNKLLENRYNDNYYRGQEQGLEESNAIIISHLESYPASVSTPDPIIRFWDYSRLRYINISSEAQWKLWQVLLQYHFEGGIDREDVKDDEKACVESSDLKNSSKSLPLLGPDKNRNSKVQLLHKACSCSPNQMPLRYIELLVDYQPQAVRTPNEDGLYPLELALDRRYTSDIIRYLFQFYPDVVHLREAAPSGYLRNMMRITFVGDLQTFQEIVAREPAFLREHSVHGNIMHCLVTGSLRADKSEICSWVLEQEPILAQQPQKKTRSLPIHLVRRVPQARALIRAYPEGLAKPDLEGNLPLHLLASVPNPCDTKLLRYVAGQYPAALLHRNEYMMSPIDLYREYCETEDLLAFLEDLRREEEQKQTKPKEGLEVVQRLELVEEAMEKLLQENATLRKRVEELEEGSKLPEEN